MKITNKNIILIIFYFFKIFRSAPPTRTAGRSTRSQNIESENDNEKLEEENEINKEVKSEEKETVIKTI